MKLDMLFQIADPQAALTTVWGTTIIAVAHLPGIPIMFPLNTGPQLSQLDRVGLL